MYTLKTKKSFTEGRVAVKNTHHFNEYLFLILEDGKLVSVFHHHKNLLLPFEDPTLEGERVTELLNELAAFLTVDDTSLNGDVRREEMWYTRTFYYHLSPEFPSEITKREIDFLAAIPTQEWSGFSNIEDYDLFVANVCKAPLLKSGSSFKIKSVFYIYPGTVWDGTSGPNLRVEDLQSSRKTFEDSNSIGVALMFAFDLIVWKRETEREDLSLDDPSSNKWTRVLNYPDGVGLTISWIQSFEDYFKTLAPKLFHGTVNQLPKQEEGIYYMNFLWDR